MGRARGWSGERDHCRLGKEAYRDPLSCCGLVPGETVCERDSLQRLPWVEYGFLQTIRSFDSLEFSSDSAVAESLCDVDALRLFCWVYAIVVVV
jgi:hypothetical protein